MEHRKIIGEAWEFTQNNKRMILWYTFLPSLLSILAGIIYVSYQFYAFKSSPLFENWSTSFGYMAITTVVDTFRDNISSLIPFIVAGIVIVLLYIFIPPICEGAIIQMIARKKNGQEVKTFDGIKYGLWSFLPMFDYSWLVRTFSLVSILGTISTIARNLGLEALQTLSPVFIVFTLVAITLTLLFTYTEFFIVIDDTKVIESVSKSSQLVVKHFSETLMLSILMAIISLRIIMQIVFVMLIPLAIFASIYFFTLASLEVVGIAVGLGLGMTLLYIAAYLSGTIHVFAATVWTFTFLELTNTPEYTARGMPKDEKAEVVKDLKDRVEKLEKPEA